MNTTYSGATISECGSYRYRLWRQWSAVGSDRLLFVMLNPSTADAHTDDPTLRRCAGFARRLGFGGVEVVNLFAYRATDPTVMWAATDPVGPENDQILTAVIPCHLTVVAAWGAPKNRRQQQAMAPRVALVRELAGQRWNRLYHLGLTRDGHPRHPLYLPADAPLTRWDGGAQ